MTKFRAREFAPKQPRANVISTILARANFRTGAHGEDPKAIAAGQQVRPLDVSDRRSDRALTLTYLLQRGCLVSREISDLARRLHPWPTATCRPKSSGAGGCSGARAGDH